MTKLIRQWNRMDMAQRVVTGLGLVAVLLSLTFLVRLAIQPSMVVLYSGLDASQSGDIVQALDQDGEDYEIRGGTILVSSLRRDELRMKLAGEGLPTNHSKGYELLDSLSGFGTTSQMFDAAYLRAKEGELARTIISSPNIANARVHIAQTRQSAFQRDTNGTASIFVTASGGRIDANQAKALRYLVASAVAGISPENVAVIDDKGQLLGAEDDPGLGATGDELSQTLKNKVERLLAARVGPNNAIVEVSVETILQTESIKERVFDPEGRVVVSTDNEETSDTSEGGGAGNVTVASNIPDGDAANADTSKSNASMTRERVNYEVSETQREILKSPGAIKRLSVAVLINQETAPDDTGEQTARTPEEMTRISELVRSAVGFDEARGDTVTVQSMAFAPSIPLGTGPIDRPFFDMTLDMMTIVQMAILGFVGVVLGLAVVRPILKASAAPELPALAPPQNAETADTALSGEIDFDAPSAPMMTVYDPDQASGAQAGEAANPIQKLREMIETRQEETVEILRQWLEQKEKQNS